MFENPRRGRQARNFTTNVPKIPDLKSSSEQIFFRKSSLGAPDRGQSLADDGDNSVKVFDSNGKFDFRFNPQTDDAHTTLVILDVATVGEDDKIYLLVELVKPEAKGWETEMQVFKSGCL